MKQMKRIVCILLAAVLFIGPAAISARADWKYENKKWYYYDETTNQKMTGWLQDGNKWYFLKSDGTMATGWAKAPADNGSNEWFYSDKSGAQKTGWVYDNGKWYYLDESMVYGGYAEINGKTYYFNNDGSMVTGWKKLSSSTGSLEWFFFDKKNGDLKTGWVYDGGKWYYCDQSMLHDGYKVIGGKTYYFNSSGAMVTGWAKLKSTAGTMEWYYFDKSGAQKTGWLKDGGKWYYLNPNMVKSGTYRINGKNYKFNSSGVCTNP